MCWCAVFSFSQSCIMICVSLLPRACQAGGAGGQQGGAACLHWACILFCTRLHHLYLLLLACRRVELAGGKASPISCILPVLQLIFLLLLLAYQACGAGGRQGGAVHGHCGLHPEAAHTGALFACCREAASQQGGCDTWLDGKASSRSCPRRCAVIDLLSR